MSGILDDPEEYKKNPLFEPRIYSDFSYFYLTASVCTIFLIVLCAINVFFCWCSSNRHYWKDSDTGNRWILPIWVKLPSKQPPLDLVELEAGYTAAAPRPVYDTEEHEEFVQLQKRESDL